MTKKYVLIAILVITVALLISAFTMAGISRSNGSQVSKSQDLTSLNAADASAYRYTAMARYYEHAQDLTSFNAVDASAYRYTAMAKYYESQAITAQYSPYLAMAMQYREHVYPGLSSSYLVVVGQYHDR